MRWLLASVAAAVAGAGRGATLPAVPALPQVISRAADAAPPGWSVLASATGDLNRDGRPDLAVALAQVSPAMESYEDGRPRLLALYLRGKDGRLRRSAVSEHALLPKNGGGVWGDPFDSLTVRRGAVVVSHYGGSADRWGLTHRFRLQEGDWRLIGETTINHNTLSMASGEVDRNLVTGLTLAAERPEGEHAATTRRAYHELRAGPGARPPVVDGRLAPDEWAGPAVLLAGADDIVEGRAGWHGPADLSARLSAATHGGDLYLRAEITDDRLLPKGDAVRLVDDKGRTAAPQASRLRPGGKGYVWEARYALAGLPRAESPGEAEPQLRVSVEVVDADAPREKDPSVLSTSRGGRRYPASIRLAPEIGLPTLSRFRLPL